MTLSILGVSTATRMEPTPMASPSATNQLLIITISILQLSCYPTKCHPGDSYTLLSLAVNMRCCIVSLWTTASVYWPWENRNHSWVFIYISHTSIPSIVSEEVSDFPLRYYWPRFHNLYCSHHFFFFFQVLTEKLIKLWTLIFHPKFPNPSTVLSQNMVRLVATIT